MDITDAGLVNLAGERHLVGCCVLFNTGVTVLMSMTRVRQDVNILHLGVCHECSCDPS